MLRKTIYLFLSVVSFTSLFSQLEKGDKFYKNAQYVKAISCFEKVAHSGSASKKEKQEALVKLGNSYKKINDYAKAEQAYSEALTIKSKSGPTAEFLYNYAQVLKANTKYQEAAEQYNNYIKLNPNDVNVKNAMKFCQEIKFYLSKPIEYKVKGVESINTDKSEFAPFVSNGRLLFVAEREEFNFVDYTVNDYNGQPYMHLYVSELKGKEVLKPKEFTKKINTEYYDGPACLSPDGKTLYFSRVAYQAGKDEVNQAKIYSTTSTNGTDWNEISLLNVSDDAYSVSHPCISADNNTLFFSSNMPGGYGGKDIYMSRRSGITWTKPVNLGPDINTSGDEMYPALRKDGILFFSSNGLPGYGSLDIYSAQKIDNKWILIRNEGLNLNSSADDFGITFVSDSTGYFSSNREGGKGLDDIYHYSFTSKAANLSAKVLLTKNLNNPAKNLKVTLRDDSGKAMDSTRTDEKGFFVFKNVNAEANYMAVLDEEDPAFAGKARFYLAVKDSVIYRVSNKIGKDKFVFKNLAADMNGLPDMFTDDDLTLAGNLLYGTENGSKPIKNTRIRIVNDAGDVMEEVVTNELGAFVFRKIPGDQNYIISVEEGDVSLTPGTRVFLTNKNGKELRSFIVGKDKFNFKILHSDKALLQEMDVEDAELLMNVYGYMYDENKKAIVNAKIHIREEGTNKIYDWTTSENGRFNFKNLDADKSYLFETDENDPALTGTKRIYIADNKGKIFKVLDIINGKFNFKIVEPDKYAMGEFIVDDPWLQALDMKGKTGDAPLTIVESILYASGDYKPDAAGQKILDKVASVLASNPKLMIDIMSHTDSRSSDAFNLELSRKRAQTAVDYIAAKGIEKKRMKAVGLGETKLLNKCANGVPCTDDEHKVNRRTEFKITESPKL